MLVIEQIPAAVEPAALAGKQRDTLVMTCEQRPWPRQRLKTTAAREVALALPTGTSLAPGTVIAVGADWYIEIEAAPEALLVVRSADRDAAIRVAFEVGNHHFPLSIEGDELIVPDDSAMEQLLNRLGVRWERRHAAFNPIARGKPPWSNGSAASCTAHCNSPS